MESGDSKKRKRLCVGKEPKSKASYADIPSSQKSTLRSPNVVEVSSNGEDNMIFGNVIRQRMKKNNMKEKKKIHKKKKIDVSFKKKEINWKEKDDVALDKGKKVAEDRSEKEVGEKDHVYEEMVNSCDCMADFDIILDGSRSLEIEKNALAIIVKQSTTPLVVSEPLVGSVGVEEEISDQELIDASMTISQMHLGKLKVQVNVDFTTPKDAI
ncbi:hypothetical protein L1887_15258 [Cichorium endivia]|nr:hypothetical protein L1887_15258 [Cichorium endivia]